MEQLLHRYERHVVEFNGRDHWGVVGVERDVEHVDGLDGAYHAAKPDVPVPAEGADCRGARCRTERLRAAAEAARVRQEEARLAVEKAEALLRAHLDDEQQATLDREQAFLVSVKSGRKYKVKRGQRGNVREMDDQGQEVRSFCIHPDDVPDQDAMLAQKLLLEHDEPAFRRIANVTELRLAS